MSSSSPSPSTNTYVRLVVYCDAEPEPHHLPDVRCPRNLEELKRFVEEKVGLRAKLLSYWSYTHNRYELLRDVRELLQEDGRVVLSSPLKLRPPSRVHNSRSSRHGGKEEELDLSTSRSGASSGGSASRHASILYSCQIWLETVLLQLEPLDAQRDKAEYDELRCHVARWLGNKHVGYEVKDAVRVRCPFLTRMFDATRSTRLEGNQDKVQLLYYSNNAWSVRDVLQYGFLLNKGVPKSMTAVVQAQCAGSDISTTTDTRLSIPVPQSMPAGGAGNATAASLSSTPSLPMDDVLDTQAHPFIFTSSMLGPNVKHLPARTAPHKVLLCEVAPGRRFMTDQSLTGDRTEKQQQQSPSRPLVRPPQGYDSVCYMRIRDDKGSVRSGDEASAKAEDLSVVQVQVGHSYQALPRYLLTVSPSGGPPPPLSSFDSGMVSATASPVRAPGTTAMEAAACERAKQDRAAAAAEASAKSYSSRSSRLQEWWATSPFGSPKKSAAATNHSSTPLQHRRLVSSLSAPTGSLGNTPRSTGARREISAVGHSDGSGYQMDSAPRRAASASAAVRTPRHLGSGQRNVAGTPYPDYGAAPRGYELVSDGGGTVSTPRARSQPRQGSSAEGPVHNGNRRGQQGMSGGVAPPQNSPWGAASTDRFSGGYPPLSYGYGRSPTRDAVKTTGQQQYLGSTPSRPSSSRLLNGRGLAPPTPPSPARHDSAQNTQNGILYGGLQRGTIHNGSAQPPRQWAAAHADTTGATAHNVHSPERNSFPRERSSGRHVDPAEEGLAAGHPSSPAYRDAADRWAQTAVSGSGRAGYGDAGEGGGGAPLPGSLPPPSIMRRGGGDSLGPLQSPRRPSQPAPPPAAFNQFLCTIHPRQLQSLYCTACEELTCPYCASIGAHRDHVVVEASDQVTSVHAEVHKLHEELRHWLSEYRRTEEELRAEQASYQARQQRELRTLQQNFHALKQALQQTERNMSRTVQQRSCPPPLAEASAVIHKYTQALAPISMVLSRYHNAADSTAVTATRSPRPLQAPGVSSASNGSRATTRSVPEMLQFLRTAPLLVRRVQESFAQQHQEEERRLRDGIARYHARVASVEGVYDHVDWVGLRRLLEHLGTSRSTRAVNGATTWGRSPRHESPSLSSTGVDGAAMRARSGTSVHSSPPSRVVSFDSSGGDAVSRRLAGNSPVRRLVIGDDLTSCVAHRSPPSAKRDRLLLRCLEDLQRGHIWAIQDASFYFAPGQLKAVCSTSFRLLGAQWELRIAPLPRRGGGGRSAGSAPTSSLITPGVNTGMMAATALTMMPTSVRDGGDSIDVVAARSPLATRSLPNVEEEGGALDSGSSSNPRDRRGAPEEEWLGLFLFPQQHRLRMDFRVIAFSEVTWAEWQVTGWTTEMAGKGWGLYPFLQRKELMRTDKLARDNIVKICIAPISDLY
jgi:hypothetical protein